MKKMEADANAQPNQHRIIRQPEVLRRTGVTSTTLWRMCRAGQFPASVRLSPGTVGWLEAEVDAWIRRRFPSTSRIADSLREVGEMSADRMNEISDTVRRFGDEFGR